MRQICRIQAELSIATDVLSPLRLGSRTVSELSSHFHGNLAPFPFNHLLRTARAEQQFASIDFLVPIFLFSKQVTNMFPVLIFQLSSRCANWISYCKKYGNIGQCRMLGGYYAERLSGYYARTRPAVRSLTDF